MTVLRTVIYDSDNPSYISYNDHGAAGSVPQPPPTAVLGVHCFGVDQYSYRSQTSPPYANAVVLRNTRECGYVPPTCDIIIISTDKTDETASGANNGTANFFCSSSFPPITYYLWHGAGLITSNTTGYFTGLAPDDYFINAFDANDCKQIFTFTIQPFDTSKTHYKYRLLFKSKDGLTQFELRLFDMRNNYDGSLYPKDISGMDSPVKLKTSDPNEDKTTSIISSNLTVDLWYTGLDFTPEEFTSVPEQSWFVQLVMPGVVLFQGWVLPDECNDNYMDAPYPFTITATDGLPSLKGNSFGNGSGGQGYGTMQIPQYGLTQWCKLVKQCLDQLGYSYGVVRVISSLRYNNIYDRNLWLNIGTWSDILYDSSGVALDTYSALDLLLSGLKLTLIPSNGSFFLINWNDLWYINNGVVTDEYLKCFYEFSQDFTNIEATGAGVVQPLLQSIGFDQPLTLLNPPQSLIKDKAYNIEADINFNVLALLFENPSFENGAVQGQIPPEFEMVGTANIFCNYDPITADPNTGAFEGNWELRTLATADTLLVLTPPYTVPDGVNYIQLINPAIIDQPNQKINFSFNWRSNIVNDHTNAIAGIALVYHDNATGFYYTWENVPTSGNPKWVKFTADNLAVNMNVNQQFLDRAWHNFSVTTDQLPDSTIGTINVRIYMPWYYYDYSLGSGGYKLPLGTPISLDIDVLNITAQDSANPLNLQVGETHTETAVTGIPLANLKQLNQSLFTFTTNKRVAGNVFYGFDYATAPVQNLWNFALKSADPQDRLAATVSRSIARNYFYNMRKFEGAISATVLQYYGIFTLRFYEGELFMAFSLEGDLRNSVWNVVLIQINDSDSQFIYQYLPKYQRNSRQNG